MPVIGGGTTETLVIERTISSPLEDVWRVAGNFLKSPGPSVLISAVKQGDPCMNGAGAERIAKIIGISARERLDTIVPFNHFTYTIVSGPPTRDHTGRVDFVSKDNATIVRWVTEFTC